MYSFPTLWENMMEVNKWMKFLKMHNNAPSPHVYEHQEGDSPPRQIHNNDCITIIAVFYLTLILNL